MSRLSVFDSPLLLGFDHFERVLDRAKASSEGYPPYNIEQLSEEDIRITGKIVPFFLILSINLIMIFFGISFSRELVFS